MSLKLTAVLAVILALVGGYYAYFEMKVFPQQMKAQEEAKKIFTFKADEIKEIALKRPDEEILCVKDESNWTMLKPVTSKGDNAAIEALAVTMADAKYDRVLDDESPDMKSFGLEPPRLQLWATKKDGTPSRKLSLGEKSPTTTYAYARLDDEKKVFLLPASAMDGLDKKVYDLRGKKLFDFAMDQVDGLEVATDSWRMVAHRVDKEKWAMVAPLDAPVQSGRINFLLGNLLEWNVKEFVAEKAEDLSQYGLDKPAYTIQLKTRRTPSQQVLIIGSKDEAKNGVFAHVKDSKSVVMFDAKILADLPKDAFDVRDKDFVRLDRDKVEKIRLAYPQNQIILTKKDADQWIIEDAVPVRADKYKVSNILADVDDAEIVQFFDTDPPSPEITGINAPAVRAEFWIKGQDDPVGVELGQKTADGKGVYARRIPQARVDVVDAKLLTKLSKTAFDLQFRKLIEFDNKDIESIAMTLAGKEIEINREGVNLWRMTRPEKRNLNATNVFSFLWAINDLEFKDTISADGQSVPPKAFETVKLKVKLDQKKEPKPGTLIIGADIPDKKDLVYCRLEGKPAVWAVDKGVIAKAEKAVEKGK